MVYLGYMATGGTSEAGPACMAAMVWALVALLPPFGPWAGQARDAGSGEAAGQSEQTRAEPALALDDGALRALYLDLVGRPPFSHERAHWLGLGRHELLDALLGSEAFWEHWYEEQLYYFLLIDNFRPRSERLRELPADLAQGRLTVRDAIHRIALSSSFDQRNPGADTFVTVVLEQLNGVRVQAQPRVLEIGKTLYDGGSGHFLGRSGSSQSDVVRIAIEDRRFEQTLMEREHLRWVGVEPERSALADDARALRKDPGRFVDLVRPWFLSPEYDRRLEQGRPLRNRAFVNMLFVDLLGREPDPDEQRRVRSALDGLSDPLPLRAVLARALLDSEQMELPDKASIDDPTLWVGEQFRRLLGREASEAELAAFVGAFHDPACRLQTVLHALVSHPEYHSP